MTRLFFVAGESSGDMHGATVIEAIRKADRSVECEGLGGRRMAGAGMVLRFDLAGRAIMGFTEVVRSLGLIRRVFHDTVKRLKESRPDALILIDYPGFNIELAKRAKTLGIPVVYYISPQVWAWKKKRIHTIARTAAKVLVILPFEQAMYEQVGADCVYVGHPLLDHIATTELEGRYSGRRIVGVLPGSREQEIQRLMGPMTAIARELSVHRPEFTFVVPCVDAAREAQVKALSGGFPFETDVGGTYEVLSAARFCLVASGTATLETALFGVPMAILYRVTPLTYHIARRLVRIEHIGLVNILAGREIVPEFIQDAIRPETVVPTALRLLDDTPERARMLADLEEVRLKLGGGGASERAAQEILQVAKGGVHG